MESFISTLEKQREQQVSTLDANIRSLRTQLDATGDAAPNETVRKNLEAELGALTMERASISDQYAALISEASMRTGLVSSSQ